MKAIFRSVILLSCLVGINAKADIKNVSLGIGSPFMACLQKSINANLPGYDFAWFADTGTYDDANPHRLAKVDFILYDKATNQPENFKVVITSEDKDKGWQYLEENTELGLWSSVINDTVQFSTAPDQSPVISSFVLTGCQGRQ